MEILECPVETTLTLIGAKWKLIIIKHLLVHGTLRYGQLKKLMSTISAKVLTDQLREMESDGLVVRTVYPEVPPRVEYHLTELGYSLQPILGAMLEWGTEFKKSVAAGKSKPGKKA